MPLDFLSNQPVEGVVLSHAIASASVGQQQALQYAIQIGAILNEAHSAGRFHGHLSPTSVIITDAGARPVATPDAGGVEEPEFRAPEQLRGETADCGTDVFAFGALLRWLISRAGAGSREESVNELIASLTEQNPLRRRRDLRQAVLQLRVERSVLLSAALNEKRRAASQRRSPKDTSGGHFPARGVRWRFAWMASIALFVVAASAVAAVLLLDHRAVSPAFKFAIVPPEHAEYTGAPAVSPDGLRVVFPAITPDGHRMLWMRSLDELQTGAIPGTDDGAAPFWSPDSSMIGFFASGSMRKVGINGAPPETICSAEMVTGGGAWSSDGTILFAPGLAGGLYRVPAVGGTPQRVLDPDPAKGERAYLWPMFLPDRQHFLFFARTDRSGSTGMYISAIGEPEHRMLFGSESNAIYAASAESHGRGALLFSKDGELMSQLLNESRLQMEGDPAPLADSIETFGSLSLVAVSVSNNGILAYQTAGRRTRHLAWMDRAGRLLSLAGGPGDYGAPRISADGRRITVERTRFEGNEAETLMLDGEGKIAPVSAVPFGVLPDEDRKDAGAVSPDGRWLAYESNDSGNSEVYIRPYKGRPSSGLSGRQVSVGGGYLPRWDRDQSQVYYLSPAGDLMSVTVRFVEGVPTLDEAHALFRTRLLPNTRNSFDVSPDGQSFLLNLPLEDATSTPITVVTNWMDKLK